MSEPWPDSRQCKRNAINALAQVAAIDPYRDEAVEIAAGVVAIVQVWATLATVPDEERIEVREETTVASQPPVSPRWKSGGGAGQWNG